MDDKLAKKKRLMMTPIEIDGIEVSAWSPGEPDDNKPFTQVHVLLDINALDVTLVLRFKSRMGMENFIRDLRTERDRTWPKKG